MILLALGIGLEGQKSNRRMQHPSHRDLLGACWGYRPVRVLATLATVSTGIAKPMFSAPVWPGGR
jgi:hypothetical protein